MHPKDLERYSFIWSEVRLVIAAIALLLGGVPPIFLLTPDPLWGIARLGLVLCWILSGLASGYLLYRWYDNGQKLFGHKNHTDTITFLILIVSGINLGLAGVFGRNIGMTIFSGKLIFVIVAILYLYCAYHLWMHYKKLGNRLF